MRSLFVTSVIALVMLTCGQAAYAQGIPIGVKGSIPLCTHAALHAATCQKEIDGYLATITDGNPVDPDRCTSTATAGGSEQVTCRRKAGDWEELPGGSAAKLKFTDEQKLSNLQALTQILGDTSNLHKIYVSNAAAGVLPLGNDSNHSPRL